MTNAMTHGTKVDLQQFISATEEEILPFNVLYLVHFCPYYSICPLQKVFSFCYFLLGIIVFIRFTEEIFLKDISFLIST